MKSIKKLGLVLAFFFCFVLACQTRVNADSWIVRPERQKTGYRFECGNYADQNYLSVDKFYLTNDTTGEQRRAYCIQKRVTTTVNVIYNMREFDINTFSLSDMISTYAWGDGNNNAINYFNELSPAIRRSLNIAAMWEKTYHPNEDAAIVATQWFMWAQTTGYASAFQENQAHDPKTPLGRIDNGYRYLDMNYGSWNTDTNNNGIFSPKGSEYQPHRDWIDEDGDGYKETLLEVTWDMNLTNLAAQRYIELVNYYETFNDNLAPNLVLSSGSDNIIYPGETIRYVDTNGVLSKEEFTVDKSKLPTGVDAYKSGNELVVTVPSNYSGYFKGDIYIKRFALNNPGTSRWYSNGTHQILFEGALPVTTTSVEVEIVSMKAKVQKTTTSTTGNKGDSTLQGAVYGIYSDASCTNLVTTITTDENGTATSGFLPGTLFYAKEISQPTGTLLNDEIYEININNGQVQPDGTILVTFEAVDDIIEGNLEILKRLGATDYDEEINLKGAQFKVTLNSDPNQEYLTTVSGEDGICKLDNIPYGTYTVSEYITPNEAYKIEDFEVSITEEGYTYEFTKVDASKEMKIAVEKVLLEETVGKTDAKVSGAYFTVYTDEDATQEYIDKNGNPVIIGPTDNTGYAVSKTMRTGTYYLKETTFPEGINPDAVVPGEEVTFRDKIYKASYDNKEQGEDIVVVSLEDLVNIPNLGRVQVMKYENNPDSTEESPAAGAVLRLTLDSSNGQVYYDAVVNEYGYAEFVKEDLMEYYPYTIPYGRYTITEIKEDDDDEMNHFFIQPEKVVITNEKEIENRIVSDEPTPAWLRIVKKDKDTGADVKLEGAKYKIWDVANEKWVSLMESPSGNYIEEFETNEEGYFYTPQELQPGEYVVYETKPPKGYYLDDNLRIPENEDDLGNSDVSGYKVVVDKIATGLTEDAIYPEGGIETGSLVIEVPIENEPLVGQLEIYKTGEVLTNVQNTTTEYGEKFTPVWQERGLEGVTYEIYAAEDIKSPDGNVTYVAKGTLVDTITTDKDGYAITKELYLGEYEVREVDAPTGYQVNNDIENVVLENEDELKRVQKTEKEYSNERQKFEIEIIKNFEDVDYSTGKEQELKAIFGIYANEDIKNVEGNSIISKGGLVDIVEVEGNSEVVSTADLPEGQYVVKELYTSFPYSISTKEVVVDLEYTDENVPTLSYEAEYTNDSTTVASLNLVKISTSQFGNITVVDGQIQAENFDEEQQAFLNSISAMTPDELKQYIEDNDIKVVSGAKYGIYLDEACTQPLYIRNEESGVLEKAERVTDEHGIISLEKLPVGQYFVKELVAPAGYELSDEVVSVSLDISNQSATVYRLLSDNTITYPAFTKLDAFTGEAIPNCVFEIRDENGNLVVKSVTNNKGEASVPVDVFENGKTYTYTELEAPNIYNLNTEPHEFVAEFDEETLEWTAEKIEVENTRKTREVIVRKVDAETGEPLQGCVFTIAMIDPKTGEQKVNAKTGEPIYLVENAVTDENGEYVIPEAPMGTYKFTEIKAPEGYEMDEDLTGLVFTIDNNSPETIIFEVTNTGDIAVMVVSAVAILSVCGIAFVMIRNKRKANE